ncbi:MAG: hypothetical protein ACRDJF_00870 [Actinomycetota bacterium]
MTNPGGNEAPKKVSFPAPADLSLEAAIVWVRQTVSSAFLLDQGGGLRRTYHFPGDHLFPPTFPVFLTCTAPPIAQSLNRSKAAGDGSTTLPGSSDGRAFSAAF